jgi:hypothetical protein
VQGEVEEVCCDGGDGGREMEEAAHGGEILLLLPL